MVWISPLGPAGEAPVSGASTMSGWPVISVTLGGDADKIGVSILDYRGPRGTPGDRGSKSWGMITRNVLRDTPLTVRDAR